MTFHRALYCFQGIAEEIYEHLLQLVLIPYHTRQRGIDLNVQGNLLAVQLILEQGDGLAQNCFHLEWCVVHRCAAGEAQQVLDNYLHAVALPTNLLQPFSRTVACRLVQEQLGVTLDRS